MRSTFTFFSRRASVKSEDGFGLIELVVASTLFIVVSAPLTGVLLASITQQKLARERTLAAQTAETAIEAVRALHDRARTRGRRRAELTGRDDR